MTTKNKTIKSNVTTGGNVFLNKLYNIRNNVIKMLSDRGYGEAIKKYYSNITINEFEELYSDINKNIHIFLYVKSKVNSEKTKLEEQIDSPNVQEESKNQITENEIIDEQIIAYFINSTSKIDKQHFKKIMQSIKATFEEKAKQIRVIIIYPDATEEKVRTTVPGYINSEQKEYDNQGKKIFLEAFSHSELAFDKTKHILQPKFILLNDKEKEELLKTLDTKKENLQKILIYDPMAKYYGAKIGDIFRIIRPSPTSGINPNVYRVVIPG
jgi:DNA-directed RNA polymerase subunit H (RpoH/RPB5)